MNNKPITRVALLRARLGITQGELAARIGVSQQTIDRLDRGAQNETKPQKLLLDQIEASLAVENSVDPVAAPASADPAPAEASHVA